MVESAKRKEKRRLQEQALLLYRLGDLVGHSVARLYSNSAKYPELETAFPFCFDVEQKEEERAANQDKLSILRFKQFAKTFNKKFSKEVKEWMKN